MRKNRRLTLLEARLAQWFCFLMVGIFVFGISACAQGSEAYPSAWIDYPLDGARIPVGVPVMVISHAFAREGVAEVVLSVNGEAYRRDAPVEAGSDFVSVEQEWVPMEAGLYTLQVQAYDRGGQPGNPDVISVEVIGGEAQASPTLVVTVTPVETVTGVPTVTSVVTVTAVATVTSPPPPPTEPPTPPPTEPPPPPADTTPPPVPSPAVPADGLELACTLTQTLAWLPVDDPSGVAGYYVKLEKEISPGKWQSAAGYGPVGDKQVGVTVDCGIRYRWSVRAEDGAGNVSDWSAPSTFSVTLN